MTNSERFLLKYKNPNDIKTVGERIRYYRYQANLTQDEVAEALGINSNTYFYYELGKYQYHPLDKLTQIAQILGIDEDLLLDDYYRFMKQGQRDSLLALYEARHITRKELSEQIGISPSTLYHWETEKTRIERNSFALLYPNGLKPFI